MMSRICEVITKTQGAVPVILNFENGSVLPNHSSRICCELFNDTNNGKDFIVSISDNIVYKGQVEDSQNAVSLVAVKSRTTNKVRLIEINKCILSPVMNESLGVDFKNKSKREMYSMLNKTFGSKRTKRRTELRDRMTVNIDEIKEQLEKTIQTTTVNPEDLVVITQLDALSAFLPPIHRDATSVDKVFILTELIEPEILDILNETAEVMLDADVEDLNSNEFVRKHMLEIQKSDSSTRIQACAVLIYIEALMNYLTIHYRELSKKNCTICTHSIEVNNQILNKFSMKSTTGRTRPNSMRDKVVAYIIALSLMTLEYKVHIEDLTKVLKLGSKKLVDIARAIGVSQSKRDGADVLVLQLPLAAPFAAFKKGKGGKSKK